MADEPNLAPIGIVTPTAPAAAPAQAAFQDHGEMPNEPATDRKLELADGTMLRERLVSTSEASENVLLPNGAPTMVSFVVSNALLNEDGTVATDTLGRPMVATKHEIVWKAETLGRLGSPEAVDEAMRREREIAAASAKAEFDGMALLSQVRR